LHCHWFAAESDPAVKLSLIRRKGNFHGVVEHAGDWSIRLIAAGTFAFAVLFAFSLMVLTNQSAILISIGTIDFWILVDASIVVPP
jgi:hypothetical protein